MRTVAYLFTSITLLIGTSILSSPLPELSGDGVGAFVSSVSDTTKDPDEHPMADWARTDIQREDIPAPEDNPITDEKVKLGRKLFFDPRLSKSNTMSCATCHDPAKGYSDGEAFSDGDNGELGPRTTPTIINLAWSEVFNWDGRASSLQEQAAGPIETDHEMREDLDTLPQELREAGYRRAFRKAFGPDSAITADNILKALATFERTLVSQNAPFDRYMEGDEDAMTPAQVRGMELFGGKANCTKCHSGPHFTDFGFHNIGVDTTDVGRYEHLPLPTMKFAFKTPTLRDVEHRAPYLHDGSEKTLREVMEFYNRGGNPSARETPNFDNEPLHLTDREIEDLVAFMKALSGDGAHGISPPELPNESQIPDEAEVPGR